MPNVKRRAPRTLTALQLRRASAIDPLDIQHARAAWRDDAPQPYKALLDARPQEPNDGKRENGLL